MSLVFRIIVTLSALILALVLGLHAGGEFSHRTIWHYVIGLVCLLVMLAFWIRSAARFCYSLLCAGLFLLTLKYFVAQCLTGVWLVPGSNLLPIPRAALGLLLLGMPSLVYAIYCWFDLDQER